MKFKSHALTLAQFVDKYAPLWSEEIMNEYPQTINDYPSEWIELLDTLTPEELYQVDCKVQIKKIEGTSFQLFMQDIKELSFVESIVDEAELPLEDWAFNGVKKKKRHEIQKITPVLRKLRQQYPFERVVDIGGGVGHLSRVLSHYHQIPSLSVDQNSEFQKIGKERLGKFRKNDGARDVEFINLTFGAQGSEKTLQRIFNNKSLNLGLHTCGPLANMLIQAAIEHKTMGLLSFGCCYHKMSPKKDFPLSDFYKKNIFPTLNLYALSLATRSHAEMTFETYKTKERVKNYRYALHLFLMRHFNNKYFTDVGECHISIYSRPFSFYIKDKLKELKLEHPFTDDEFNEFYHSSELQRELRIMFLCNIIRWQLGRVLEVYLQVDRCLYLEENGFEVKLEAYFNEALSPRNLGILALIKS
jgi:hypothetical protein